IPDGCIIHVVLIRQQEVVRQERIRFKNAVAAIDPELVVDKPIRAVRQVTIVPVRRSGCRKVVSANGAIWGSVWRPNGAHDFLGQRIHAFGGDLVARERRSGYLARGIYDGAVRVINYPQIASRIQGFGEIPLLLQFGWHSSENSAGSFQPPPFETKEVEQLV